MLQDMAILTNGQVIAEEVGLKLDGVTIDMMGTARKVVVTKDETTIVEGAGEGAEVERRLVQPNEHFQGGMDADQHGEGLDLQPFSLACAVMFFLASMGKRGSVSL